MLRATNPSRLLLVVLLDPLLQPYLDLALDLEGKKHGMSIPQPGKLTKLTLLTRKQRQLMNGLLQRQLLTT